ncbi:autotransporter family protein [Rhodoplanes sp. Z2-YC6860]|uniref:autotransporter family protein n=1 Tax=Rhodoplanes sp. Z2-YC6860 TaxID=674703 RepID=UPI0018DB7782|nr:autotransporter outer membrane beta-barrel domain-containing protein [Rhodoplanes sp. Z2-YC6860]
MLSVVGNATATNSGSVGGSAGAQVSNTGDATIINSGRVGVDIYARTGNIGNATAINSGSVGGQALASARIGNAMVVNSGAIGNGVQVSTTISGNAALTSFAGSSIFGSITVQSATGATAANFFGGNYQYTFSGPGVPNAINTNGAPFVVSGNSVAVLDPTAFALADRSVMQFTAGVSSMLQDRFGGMGIAGGASAGAMGFAPTAASRVSAAFGNTAEQAFSSMPSVAISYSSAGANNAYAMFTKAPPRAQVYDTVVWTSGFGGERRQHETDSILGARDTAYGGAIGVDRQFTNDLRLGAFVGAGSSRMQVDFDVQRIDTDYVFGGGYGRYSMRNAFVDFALFGGSISNKSQRNVANNLAPGGLEQATASYGGWFISPDVTYGYRLFVASDTTVTPKARVRYVGGSLDAFTETGSAQNLSIGRRSLSDIEERLGVEVAGVVPALISGTIKGSVELSGVGLQRLGDTTINGTLLTQNIAFTTPGKSEAYGGALNVGVDWRSKDNISVYASAEGTAMNDRSRSAAGKGGIRIGF